jgi:hypothetical protein
LLLPSAHLDQVGNGRAAGGTPEQPESDKHAEEAAMTSPSQQGDDDT